MMEQKPFFVNDLPEQFDETILLDFLGYIAEALEDYGLSDFREISLSFVNKAQISNLNSEYYGVEGPTDILSFCLGDEEDGLGVLGDLYLHPGSFENDFSLENEDQLLHFLIAHGVLHLLGFTHDNKADFDQMILIQKALVERESRSTLEKYLGA